MAIREGIYMDDMRASNVLNTLTKDLCFTAGNFHIFKLETKHPESSLCAICEVQCNIEAIPRSKYQLGNVITGK